VVSELEPVAESFHISLACECCGNVTVTGDPDWLKRLLLNLLDNAIKFTPAGGRITVSVKREDRTARLVVRDTGIGIPHEALPHIFERFYLGEPAPPARTSGVGLGLSLVKWIADRHGATIDVASQRGYGTTFTVNLPIRSL
jgi:signal transduction histidine kinase